MTQEARPKAFSYIRFSTPEQSKGDSLRRQTEAAQRYADLNGLALDTDLTFRDLGVSAYHGANIDNGELGVFLSAVESKDIPAGSYLIIESLDRLSRNKPRKAVRLLENICEAGITLVTLDDGREYTEEIIDNDPTALLVAFLVAARANEESYKKALRLSAAWNNKRTQAYINKKPLSAICPAWLSLSKDRSEFIINRKRAKVVQEIFQSTIDGMGQHSIAKNLTADGVDVFGRGKIWHRSYISKLLFNEAVIGTYTPHKTQTTKNGKKLRIPLDPILDYFPPIIAPELYKQVQSMKLTDQDRKKTTGRTTSRVAFILAGLAKCPKCQSTMTRINKGPKGGRPYLICVKAKVGAGCRYKQINLDYVQEMILSKAVELEIKLPAVDTALQERWEFLLQNIDLVGNAIDHITKTIEEYGSSRALSKKLSNLEETFSKDEKEFEMLGQHIGNSISNRVKNAVSELILQCKYQPPHIPKINTLLHQLFDHVEVDYQRGELYFHWKHTQETTRMIYSLPEELIGSSKAS